MPLLLLIYLVARTVAAVALVVVARRRGLPWVGLGGQVAADALAVILVYAFGDHELRRAIGWWALPAWAYVAAWEGAGAFRRWGEWDEAESAGAYAEMLAGALRRLWDVFIVAPPILLGMAVAVDIMMPGSLQLPDPPPAMLCTPTTLGSRDTLRVRFERAHGGELTIITPAGRGLVVVPFAAADVPREERFEEHREVRFVAARTVGRLHSGGQAERVFADTGLYLIRVSEPAEISASLVCRVRYVNAADAAPLPPR